MFQKIKNIFGYIWRSILHNFFTEKYWDLSDLCTAFGGTKKKVPPLLTWFRPIEYLKPKKEKISLNCKVVPIQWRRILEKYQKTKLRSYEKKSVFLPIKWSFFQCQIVNFHPIKNILRHCRVNIFNSTQYKFQANRIIALQVTISANLKNVISRKTRLKI